MNPNRLSGLFIMLAGLLLFITCRKMDYSPPDANYPSLNTVTDKFFNSHRSNDPTEKALVDYLKRVNEKEKFVGTTVKRIGFPRWDKILTPSFSRFAGRTESDSSAITYYIPFVRDSQNYVNASMAIRTTPSDTTFSYLCDWQYSQMQNNTASYQDTAEYFAIFFMTLDKNVFGYNNFNITDKDLFKNGNTEARFITLSNTNSNKNNLAELLMPVEVCQDVTVYFTDCTYPGHPDCTPTCDGCWECTSHYSYQYCWTEYVDDGSGGGSGGGTGGTGGGSSGGSTPPPCPSTPAARTENVTNPCTGGWTPNPGSGTSNFPENPCKVVDSLMTTNNFPLYYTNLRNGVTNNFESGFMFWNPFAANTTFEEVDGVPGTLGVDMNPATPMGGVVHNHYNDSLSLSVFSFDDFYKLYDWFSNGSINNLQTFTFGMVTDSSAYIMMVTDSTAFANFGNTYLNNRENIRIFMSVFYDGYGIHEAKSVAENEKAFLKALQGLGTGISFFRANNNITQFTKLRVNESDQVRPSLCN